ncbi:protein ImuA [Mycoplana sp. BE70]|uniref:ImuA family protein n=1 Tax=Mycoplana sp. BE70 TaxID=2817775 RepID=UPI0028541C92|nr:hypothetical protein [Mycoplana sp. BE70]MDR6755861.1 protein ImuA [Mycoplana sp. BE70]
MATPALAQRRLFALRETIARIENADGPGLAGRKRRWQWDMQGSPGDVSPFSESGETGDLEAVFNGDLPACGLVEIRNAQTRDMGAATGFSLALAALRQDRTEKGQGATLWICQALASSEAGIPYGPGLKKHGLDPTRMLLARPRTIADALLMAETALGVPAFSTVILEIRGNPAGFGLTESRRLQLRARANGTLLLLLRQAGEEEASSALYRLRIDPAPACERPLPDGTTLAGSIANPVFLVTPEKNKTADPVGILLEWNSHDRRFSRLDPRPAVPQEEQRPADPLSVVSLSARRSGGAAALGEVVAFKGAS